MDRFGDKTTRKFYEDGKCPNDWRSFEKDAVEKLDRVYHAARLETLNIPPSNNLERLRRRKDAYSIRIKGTQYRVTFIWHENVAYEIKVEDYH